LTIKPRDVLLTRRLKIRQATFGKTNGELMEALKKQMDPKGLLNT